MIQVVAVPTEELMRLQIQGLSKRYPNGVQALDRVELDLAPRIIRSGLFGAAAFFSSWLL